MRSDAPDEVRAIWSDDYPGMATAANCRALASEHGYQILGDFLLSDAAWWDYYAPLQQRLRLLDKKYAGDDRATLILQEAAWEIACYRKFSSYYGYLFLVMGAR